MSLRITGVRLDHEATDRYLSGREVRAHMQRSGDKVAARARALAPKDTGKGAASIHAVLDKDPDTGAPLAQIGWGDEGYYMRFVELGTVYMKPQPHLRPAIETPLD